MCLVSFVPISKGHFVLSSNRDESPSRNAKNILHEDIESNKVYYPADKLGGSWIFASERAQLLCILNGAFENHIRRLPYRESRGIILKDFFSYDSISDFLESIDLKGIEPFTAILYANDQLVEFRWDEVVKHIRRLDTSQTHVWSSCTLYDEMHIASRKKDFINLVNQSESTVSNIKSIHNYVDPKEDDRTNSFVMNRNNRVKTLSITQIEIRSNKTTLHHHDLLNDDKKTIQIS